MAAATAAVKPAAAKATVRCAVEAASMHAAKTAVRCAIEAAAAMKAAAETGLATAGKVVCPAAMVESAKRAGMAVRCHVRRSKAAEVPMVKPRPCAMKIMKGLTVKFTAVKAVKVVTMKITAGEAVAMVKKDMASGNKPSVVKNHETTAPVAAPETPAPGKVMMKMADGKTTEPNKRANEEIDIARVHHQRRSVHHPWVVGGKIDDLRIRRLDDDRLALGRHRLLLRGFQGAGVFRALAHNLDGGHNLLRVIVIGVS